MRRFSDARKLWEQMNASVKSRGESYMSLKTAAAMSDLHGYDIAVKLSKRVNQKRLETSRSPMVETPLGTPLDTVYVSAGNFNANLFNRIGRESANTGETR